MVHRINDRGTYVIDRRYKGVGRIRRASGTNNQKTFNQILSMLKNFMRPVGTVFFGRFAMVLLLPLKRKVTGGEEKLEHLPSAATLKPIAPTIPDWIQKHEVGETTRRNYKSEITCFTDFVGESLSIQDLPGAVQRYRDYCVERGTIAPSTI